MNNLKSLFLTMALVAVLLVGLATSGFAEAGAYAKIGAAEGKEMMDAGGVVVVDVRRADEYAAGHIPGAINIPNESISDMRPEALPELDAQLIVYCRTGVRSKDASDKLVALGYAHVADMGGIVDWPYDQVEGSEPGVYPMAETDPIAQVLNHFSTEDINGNPVDSSIFKNADLTLVNIWGTFCGPCLNEMPHLGELAEEYKDKGVQFLGIVCDTPNRDGSTNEEVVALAREIAEKTGATYTHLPYTEDFFALDSVLQYVPTTVFVDSEGKLVGEMYVDSMDKAGWAKAIEETLGAL